MAELFKKNVPTINGHVKNVFFEGELEENGTIRKFRIVQMEGNKEVEMVRLELARYNQKKLE